MIKVIKDDSFIKLIKEKIIFKILPGREILQEYPYEVIFNNPKFRVVIATAIVHGKIRLSFINLNYHVYGEMLSFDVQDIEKDNFNVVAYTPLRNNLCPDIQKFIKELEEQWKNLNDEILEEDALFLKSIMEQIFGEEVKDTNYKIDGARYFYFKLFNEIQDIEITHKDVEGNTEVYISEGNIFKFNSRYPYSKEDVNAFKKFLKDIYNNFIVEKVL